MEGRVRCDVVDEDGAGGATVVGSRYGPEALGAGGVPELCTRIKVLVMLRPARDGVLAGHVPAKTGWDGVWSDL